MLTEAGYVHTSGAWMREGRPLSVVVAAPAGEEPLATVAEEVRRQLTSAGVQARVVSPDAEQLFTQLLVDPLGQDPIRADGGAVNIAVASLPAGANSASVLATNFGCSPDLVDGIRARPGNPAGFCDSTVQSTIDAALTGAMTLDDALATIEPELWRQAVVIPLYQAADTLVVRKEVSGVDMRSPLSGPFGAAVLWRREALR